MMWLIVSTYSYCVIKNHSISFKSVRVPKTKEFKWVDAIVI